MRQGETIMPTVAIIGASRGDSGSGSSSGMRTRGWRVHATTRNPERPGGARGGRRRRAPSPARGDRSLRAAARFAMPSRTKPSTSSSHNAGVYGRGMSAAAVHRINAEAPIEVAEALMDAVLRSGQRKIALVTSTDGRPARLDAEPREVRRLEGGPERPLPRPRGGLARAGLHRGSSSTRGGCAPTWAGATPRLSVEESARGIREVMAALDVSGHGRFRTWDGRDHPW